MIMFHGTNLHFQTILYIAFYPVNATKSLRYSIRKRRGQMGMLVKGKLTRTFGIRFSRNRTYDDSVLHPNKEGGGIDKNKEDEELIKLRRRRN